MYLYALNGFKKKEGLWIWNLVFFENQTCNKNCIFVTNLYDAKIIQRKY